MKISIKLGQRLPSFTKSPTSQDKFHSYMMIKRVVDRFLSTGFIFICSRNQNVPVQTENHVSSYLCSLPPAEVRRAAENLLLDKEGSHLKHVLKKYKNRAPEE